MKQSASRSVFYEGIDLLRGGAVFLVLWSHAGIVLPHSWHGALAAPWFRPGFWGVTTFFAISGFLVVGQLIDIATDKRGELLRAFVLRRWFRTVPTYWIVLLLLLVAGSIGWLGWKTWLANIFFLQGSIFVHEPNLLSVSWSLVIEEWSYLIFAFAIFILIFLKRRLALGNARVMALVGGLLIASIVCASFARYIFIENGGSVRSLKQGLFLQLDALAYGGLLALFMRTRPRAFEVMTLRPIAFSRIVALIAVISVASISGNSLFRSVLEPVPIGLAEWLSLGFYPMAGLLACALIVGFWGFEYSILPKSLSQMIRILSKISYSVYLLHVPFAHVVAGFELPALIKFGMYVLGSILVGYTSWVLIEKPFMQLRRCLV